MNFNRRISDYEKIDILFKIKEVLKGTQFCKATMKTIQLKLIKVAARVKIMKTKVKIELPADFYSKPVFVKCFGMFEVLRI